MSKKITQISSYIFTLVLEPAIRTEFEKSMSYKSIDDEAKEWLNHGVSELVYKINDCIQSGKLLAVEEFTEACIVNLGDEFYKMFISVLGINRKSEEKCIKDFSFVLNIRELKSDDENYRKWVEEEERQGAIILAEIEAEELKQKNNKEEENFGDEFGFEEVPEFIKDKKFFCKKTKNP